jgi:hypothetical protein
MDESYTVEVFDWHGELHVTCDRVGRSAGRRYAPRTRLWSESAVLAADATPRQAVAFLALAVAHHAGDLGLTHGAERPPEPPEGATGGARHADPNPATRRDGGLTSGTAAPPRKAPRDAVASDGLLPEGGTIPLF